MDIIINRPSRRGVSRGAFQGDMHCPFCSRHADPTATLIGFETEKQKIKLIGNIGPFMREYKCMKCGGVWRYDINARQEHPYSSFKRGLNLNAGFKKHYIKDKD